MNRYLKHVVGALMKGDKETADAYMRLNIQSIVESKIKSESQLNEDHEMYMNIQQMEKHLRKLYNLADDKDQYLKTLANYTTKDKCTDADFKECSENITAKGKDYTDKAIHKLEKQVGYVYTPNDLRESFMDIITRNALPTPPNFMKDKDVKKLKKTPPKLKKSVYGTGNPPALGMGGGSDGGSGGGDGGAGGAGGGA